MGQSKTVKRKNDHITLCLTDNVEFHAKSNGFESYEFVHNAITEVVYEKIDLSTHFFYTKIDYPLIISSMTGGTRKAEKINEKLAEVAQILNIPIGVGSQRQFLEDNSHYSSYRVVRKKAGEVPILGNIGAAQVAKSKDPVDLVKSLVELVDASAMIVHLNPLQELLQPEGEPDFSGLLKNLEKICSKLKVPVIAKEVGSGISAEAAARLLDAGIEGIDVAGSGGTSWAAVELIRSGKSDPFFREWGLPTSYCIRTLNELKKKRNFTLISSGGINDGVDIAKSLALGADVAATARIILKRLMESGVDGVIGMINSWFSTVSKIMYLTGCDEINELKKIKLIRKEEMY